MIQKATTLQSEGGMWRACGLSVFFHVALVSAISFYGVWFRSPPPDLSVYAVEFMSAEQFFDEIAPLEQVDSVVAETVTEETDRVSEIAEPSDLDQLVEQSITETDEVDSSDRIQPDDPTEIALQSVPPEVVDSEQIEVEKIEDVLVESESVPEEIKVSEIVTEPEIPPEETKPSQVTTAAEPKAPLQEDKPISIPSSPRAKPKIKPKPELKPKSEPTIKDPLADVLSRIKKLNRIPRKQQRAITPGERVNQNEKRYLVSHISGRFKVDCGTKFPERHEAELSVKLFQDGTVQSVEYSTATFRRTLVDSFARRFAESARRAILKSQPFPYEILHPEKYADWRELELIFRAGEICR